MKYLYPNKYLFRVSTKKKDSIFGKVAPRQIYLVAYNIDDVIKLHT